MITNFKIFENNENEPQKGDYIIVNPLELYGVNLNHPSLKAVQDYLKDAVGTIVDSFMLYPKPHEPIDHDKHFKKSYYVNFKNVPNDVKLNEPQEVLKKDILYWGKTEEEVRAKKQVDKYNI